MEIDQINYRQDIFLKFVRNSLSLSTINNRYNIIYFFQSINKDDTFKNNPFKIAKSPSHFWSKRTFRYDRRQRVLRENRTIVDRSAKLILMLFNLTFATYLLSPTWPRKCSRVLRITKAKVTSPICYYYHRYQVSIDGKKKYFYFYSTIVQLWYVTILIDNNYDFAYPIIAIVYIARYRIHCKVFLFSICILTDVETT